MTKWIEFKRFKEDRYSQYVYPTFFDQAITKKIYKDDNDVYLLEIDDSIDIMGEDSRFDVRPACEDDPDLIGIEYFNRPAHMPKVDFLSLFTDEQVAVFMSSTQVNMVVARYKFELLPPDDINICDIRVQQVLYGMQQLGIITQLERMAILGDFPNLLGGVV